MSRIGENRILQLSNDLSENIQSGRVDEWRAVALYFRRRLEDALETSAKEDLEEKVLQLKMAVEDGGFITVNGVRVPSPITEAPAMFTTFFYPTPCAKEMSALAVWSSTDRDWQLLERGLCHTERAAAVIHAKAMLAARPGDMKADEADLYNILSVAIDSRRLAEQIVLKGGEDSEELTRWCNIAEALRDHRVVILK